MPIFRLSDRISFPPAHFASNSGLLAIGGDLSESRLLMAYRMGIFPWFSEEDPILWWSPDPRLVLYPQDIRISRRLRRTIRKGVFTVSSDTVFDRVIEECARVRIENGEQTWLVDDMMQAYTGLHEMGYAHCVETWHEGRLAGGLYGISLGGIFFGESMFTRISDASKTALVALCAHLQEKGFDMIDCQMTTPHLIRMGAAEIPRKEFLKKLAASMQRPTDVGRWDVRLRLP
ncbi:MAG: leucyl/phenylalanyl-tRNA--protein transferase [Desulfosalsimonadaceae bacterium]